MKKHWWIVIIAAVVVIGMVAWWLTSPLYLDNVVNEEMPELQDGRTLYSSSFVDADEFHKVSGKAIIITDEDARYLRFENFEATNGPDLYVYLAEDLDAESYISVGRLKGNIGDQNYLIDDNIDLEKYDKVLVWCEAFSVLFGSADLEVTNEG